MLATIDLHSVGIYLIGIYPHFFANVMHRFMKDIVALLRIPGLCDEVVEKLNVMKEKKSNLRKKSEDKEVVASYDGYAYTD